MPPLQPPPPLQDIQLDLLFTTYSPTYIHTLPIPTCPSLHEAEHVGAAVRGRGIHHGHVARPVGTEERLGLRTLLRNDGRP